MTDLYDNYQHPTEFAGFPVIEWSDDLPPPADPSRVAIAVRADWEDQDKGILWADKFKALLASGFAEQIPALLVGVWSFEYEDTAAPLVEVLVANRDRLPNLKALYIGDIVQEEQEISWIRQDDLSPLWTAFPNLETLSIRGGDKLKIDPLKLPYLKTLRIETGGMDKSVVRAVVEAGLPSLETLVLWLGTGDYGANTTIGDLQPFYHCRWLPKLKTLGLCNSDYEDEIAVLMSTAAALDQLDTLDLSMGRLTDDGALALLTSPDISKLKKLIIHFHFCTEAMVKKLREREGVEVVMEDSQAPDREWRFVAVSE